MPSFPVDPYTYERYNHGQLEPPPYAKAYVWNLMVTPAGFDPARLKFWTGLLLNPRTSPYVLDRKTPRSGDGLTRLEKQAASILYYVNRRWFGIAVGFVWAECELIRLMYHVTTDGRVDLVRQEICP